ncbi:MAG TPA: hypothetical protein VGQ09_08105 [Chitinophagaceae bacterium]|jgi:hypothetical protein|nr:hypothetical protein [Chitinophagaceae bacterium]
MKRVTILVVLCLILSLSKAQWTTSGNNIYNSNTGNVGIGISNPSYSLDVNGTARFSIGNGKIDVFNTNTFAPLFTIDGGSLQRTSMYSIGSQNLFTIADGHTQINGSNLEFANGAYIRSFQQPLNFKIDYPGYIGVGYIFDNSIDGAPPASNYVIADFRVNGSSKVKITNDNYTLDVNGKLNAVGDMSVGNALYFNNSIYGHMQLVSNDGFGSSQVATDQNLVLSSSNSTGIMLIGSNNPSANGYALKINADKSVSLGDHNSPTLFVNRPNNTVIISGSIGIGTSNPGPYKLAVEGTLGARKVKVTQANPWADYVFEDNYKLPSLQELEKFIRKYKHLPEVPSIVEIEKNGLDLGDNQALLLKKIEELTLYVIEQNKKTEEQQKRMELLEKEIKDLKNQED